MFVEDGFSWDKEREATALDWPPLLTPELEEDARRVAPREAAAPAGERPSGIGFGDDGRILIPADPDLTDAELRATSIDSMVGAAFLAPTPHEPRDDEAIAATDVMVERPRRSWWIKGPLIMVGTAVAVGLSAGYTANAVGWRLPPALLQSVQPVTTFFRGETTRLVDAMEKLRLAQFVDKLHLSRPSRTPAVTGDREVGQPIVGPMSDPYGTASEPLSLLEESQGPEPMMSLAAPASPPDSPVATDEGTPPPMRAALLQEHHPTRGREHPRRSRSPRMR